jgi:hypothetical protein
MFVRIHRNESRREMSLLTIPIFFNIQVTKQPSFSSFSWNWPCFASSITPKTIRIYSPHGERVSICINTSLHSVLHPVVLHRIKQS